MEDSKYSKSIQMENGIVIDDQHVYFQSSEEMKDLPAKSIDLIITSPPYNRGKKYSSDALTTHNDSMDESQYLAFLTRVWKECFRVAVDSCIFFLNIGDAAKDQGISEKVALTAQQAGWTRIQDIIWVKSMYGKGHYTPSGGSKRFNNIWEHIFLFVKNKQQYVLDPKAIGIPYADKSNIGRYGQTDLRDAGNVWHICYEKTTGKKVKKGHEAPFPIGLPLRCMQCVPNAKTILDPFLGTGTTLAACKFLGLTGYGFEKYPRVSLILQTIQNTTFSPQTVPILIPHYEQSIQTLIDFIQDPSLKINSIKQYTRFQILEDTLIKLQIEGSFLQNLQEKLNYYTKLHPK